MNQAVIFGPFLGMMLLSFVVWIVMYFRRLRYIHSNRIDPQRFATRTKAMSATPDALQNPSNNLQNLFELPVLFYALCLYLYAAGQVDTIHIACAWLFLAFRCIHSLVHCTINRVTWRFAAYAAAAVALWVMLFRSLFAYWANQPL